MKFARILAAVTVGGAALGMSGAAMAGLSVGVNIGAPVYVAPAPMYAPPPPPPVYAAPVYAAPVPVIAIGWYGNRYWDGRRYWSRDEWRRRGGGRGYNGRWHR